MNNLISIIIPIYNTEKYLSKCLDSVIAQTYTNWEAILVDDGSPDNCGAICDEYASKDHRFKVIHQKNSGVSVARQTGLNNAIGDYIIHCDPDDWIESTMIKEMLDCAITNNADMVICDIIFHRNVSTYCHKQNIENSITSKELQEKIINQEIHGSCCNKLIRNSFCKKNNFYPTNISLCEDELYIIKVLNKDMKIEYIPKGLYHYVQHKTTCSTPSISGIKSRIVVLNEIEKLLPHNKTNNYIAIKKNILVTAFLSKNFELLPNLYKEVHKDVISMGIKYRIKQPLSSCLSLALKGYPRFAYALYSLNMCIIKIRNKFKHK